jgi:hypothetical protein
MNHFYYMLEYFLCAELVAVEHLCSGMGLQFIVLIILYRVKSRQLTDLKI